MGAGWHRLLVPLTPLWEGWVRGRARAHRSGLVRSHRLPVPVVSVGNLTFGGTGKTPTVIGLVRDLLHRGGRPAVLTRGYGRVGRAPLVLLGPEGADWRRAGDEPVEMATALPEVPVVVDADRVRGGRTAVELGADVIVLDDGFQHLRLARDLDLVLLDAGDPFGGGRMPPLGRLREPMGALGRADAVLVTKLHGEGDGRLATIRERVAAVAPELPLLAARLEVRRVLTPEGALGVESLRGRRVLAFSGIGRPSGLVELLAEAGAEVVGLETFPDHHPYRPAEVEAVLAAAAAREAVALTTAKDRVKLPPDAPVWTLEVAMEVAGGDWEALWRRAPGVLP